MGLPVTVYRWDDAGAPQILPTGKPSNVIDMLKKVFVTGYGTKPGLGWTVAFEDATAQKIAFRNSTINGGSGGYWQVYSSDGSDTNNKNLFHVTARGMISLDSFDRKGRIDTFNIPQGWPSNSRWIVVGNSRAAWVIFSNPQVLTTDLSTRDEPCFFVGDLDCYNPSDTGQFVIIQGSGGNSDVTGSPNWTVYPAYIFAGDNIDSFKMYDADGSATFANPPYRISVLAYSNPVAAATGVPTVTTIMLPIIVRLNYNQSDGSGVSTENSSKRNKVRGIVPGIYMSNTNCHAGMPWPVTMNVAGVEFLMLRTYNHNMTFISLGEWY